MAHYYIKIPRDGQPTETIVDYKDNNVLKDLYDFSTKYFNYRQSYNDFLDRLCIKTEDMESLDIDEILLDYAGIFLTHEGKSFSTDFKSTPMDFIFNIKRLLPEFNCDVDENDPLNDELSWGSDHEGNEIMTYKFTFDNKEYEGKVDYCREGFNEIAKKLNPVFDGYFKIKLLDSDELDGDHGYILCPSAGVSELELITRSFASAPR